MKNVFVSSTFKDFHLERDLLRSKVLPRLNYEAAKYGESVNFCDLRWGIDTSELSDEESDKKVLSICLNEIDRAHPYMIVFLGERYGYMPGENSIEQEVSRRNMEIEDLEISVTHLEIEYGALAENKDLGNIIFCFRTINNDYIPDMYLPESSEHANRLARLKERIQSLTRGNIFYYEVSFDKDRMTGFEVLEEWIYKELFTKFDREWKRFANLARYEKNHLVQWNYIEEKNKSYIPFGSTKDIIINKLEEGSCQVISLLGKSGTGKSTLFAKICSEMSEKGWKVLPILCGTTPISTSEDEIVKSLIWQLENNPDEEEINTLTCQEAKERLEYLCLQQVEKGVKLLIAADAVEQLGICFESNENILQRLKFVPGIISGDVRCFITCIDGCVNTLSTDVVVMSKMSEEDQKMVLQSIALSQGKMVSEKVAEYAIRKNKDSTPMFLYFEMVALSLMDLSNYTNIHQMGNGMKAIEAE